MTSLRVGSVPIIFPRIIVYLCEAGFPVRVVGNRRSDYKVAQLLLDATGWQDVPDLMSYDVSAKKWKEYYFTEITEIKQGEMRDFRYDVNMFVTNPSSLVVSKMENLVTMYGHAKLEIANISRYGLNSPVGVAKECTRITEPMLG